MVSPKKQAKRHKVTDTRITPRTVSRLIGDQPSMAELHKAFGPASPFMPPGFPMPKLLEDMPRPPFHHLPFPPPTSMHQQFPFNPFGFPGPLGRPRDFSPPGENRPRSASPPRDHRPPPPLLHPALLAVQTPDFGHMKHHDRSELDRPVSETSSDDFKFDKMDFAQSPFSMAGMSGKRGAGAEIYISIGGRNAAALSECQARLSQAAFHFSFRGLLVTSVGRQLLSLLLGSWFLFLGLVAGAKAAKLSRELSTKTAKVQVSQAHTWPLGN